MSEGLTIFGGKRSLTLHNPLLNSAGTLGFSSEASEFIPLDGLGAFVTNPISYQRRTPANDSGSMDYPGGLLLHSGHPNAGLSTVLRRHRRAWSRLETPTITHLISSSIQEYEHMILELEGESAVAAVELGLESVDMGSIDEFAQLAQRAELPVILRLPLDAPTEAFLRAAGAGAPALSFGPPRGQIPSGDNSFQSGRLYGPSLFPMALAKLMEVRSHSNVPIIASGGIQEAHHAQRMLQAGASALQIDLALWLASTWIWKSDWT